MTDPDSTTAPPPPPSAPPSTMEDPKPQDTKKPERVGPITFTFWPPTQRTRDAVVNRLVSTLSTPSILSKRYGTIPQDEASGAAARIEKEAYAAVSTASSAEEDGFEILQLYSREISKRMLDSIKARASAATAEVETPNPVAAASEETSSEITTES